MAVVAAREGSESERRERKVEDTEGGDMNEREARSVT